METIATSHVGGSMWFDSHPTDNFKIKKEMPVKINRNIKEPECSLYGPDGTFLGIIDSGIILNDVRLQIKRQNLEGYYIIFEYHRITIHPNGRLDDWPNGFFDTWSNQLFELIE